MRVKNLGELANGYQLELAKAQNARAKIYVQSTLGRHIVIVIAAGFHMIRDDGGILFEAFTNHRNGKGTLKIILKPPSFRSQYIPPTATNLAKGVQMVESANRGF